MQQLEKPILALDFGTKLGWAVRTEQGGIYSGWLDLSNKRYEGGGMRFLKFETFLAEQHVQCGGIGALYFEEVRRHLGVSAAHIYGGFLAVASKFCEQRTIPYAGVPVQTIKKHATGKGNTKKEDVIAAMQAKGHDVKDDNQADALALLYCVLDGVPQ
jgi:crossover junction endodeoxyribonuclease RuvC